MRWVRIGGACLALLVVIAAVLVWRSANDGYEETLGGAELLAAGIDDVDEWTIDDAKTVDDLPLGDASLLVPDGDEGFWMMLDLRGLLVHASTRGSLLAGTGRARGVLGADAVGVLRDGSVAVDDNIVTVSGTKHLDRREIETRFKVGAVTEAPNGTLLLGSGEDARIDAVNSDGQLSRLVGPPDDPEAIVKLDHDPGPIVSLRALSGGRVVFVVDASGHNQLYLLDDTEVRQVSPDASQAVAGPENPRVDPGLRRMDLLPLDPINPASDGGLLAIGIGPKNDPVITHINLESGDTKVLAELTGVDPTIEEPISAVAVGDDLVFLAKGKLWRMSNAFD